jgi:DNA-binding response OmpR family regulator
MGDRHVALIVEDDPHIADIEKELVTSLGHEWRYAATLEEVRAAMAVGGYCYVLLDLQIPANGDSHAAVGCGETALQLLRRAAPARNAAGKHTLPIVVVTSYSRDPEYVSKMYDMDASGWVTKPFGERIDVVLDKIRVALVRAEREDHTACVALAAPSRDGVVRVVRIVIDGTGASGRVFVDGQCVMLQDSYFVVFLKMAVLHLRAPGAWRTADELGIASRGWAASRVRTAFKGVVPPTFEMVEARKGTGYRLNPGVVVERIEWGTLARHGQAAVRKLAAEWGK